jgi:hypothetical protein
MTWAGFIELFWTLTTLTPFLAAIYLLERTAAAYRIDKAANDNLAPLPPIIRAEGWRE